MKTITTFEQLRDIEQDKGRDAEINDLQLIRKAYHLQDGILILIGADYSQSIDIYLLSCEFSSNILNYLKHYYDLS